nr:MAG TPA: hypothetical protein [Caudoviricetes sp.]
MPNAPRHMLCRAYECAYDGPVSREKPHRPLREEDQ